MKPLIVVLSLFLVACFPVRPDTPAARACTALAKQKADAAFAPGPSIETAQKWVQDEGRAYDACMGLK